MSAPAQFSNAETSKTIDEKTPEMEHANNSGEDIAELRAMLAKYGVELPEDDDDATVMEDQDLEKLDKFYEDCFDFSAVIGDPFEEEFDETEEYKKPGLSASLKPEKCANAPEICYWASSTQLKEEYRQLRAALVYDKDLSDDAGHKDATINTAYKRIWYPIPAGECLMYSSGVWTRQDLLRFSDPATLYAMLYHGIIPSTNLTLQEIHQVYYRLGASSKKRPLPKLPRGCKGLKEPWDDDVPTNDHVPMGVSRKHENRLARGRWFFPQQSGLSHEVKSE